MGGNGFLMPFYLELAKGLSSAAAGLVLLVYAATFMVLSPFTGRLADRHAPWRLCATGMGVGAAACVAFALLLGSPGLAGAVVFLMVLALVYALFMAANAKQVLEAAPAEHKGAASAVFGTLYTLSLLLGVSLFETVYSRAASGPVGAAATAAARADEAGTATGWWLPGFSGAYMVGAVACALALLLCFGVPALEEGGGAASRRSGASVGPQPEAGAEGRGRRSSTRPGSSGAPSQRRSAVAPIASSPTRTKLSAVGEDQLQSILLRLIQVRSVAQEGEEQQRPVAVRAGAEEQHLVRQGDPLEVVEDGVPAGDLAHDVERAGQADDAGGPPAGQVASGRRLDVGLGVLHPEVAIGVVRQLHDGTRVLARELLEPPPRGGSVRRLVEGSQAGLVEGIGQEADAAFAGLGDRPQLGPEEPCQPLAGA